MNLTEKAIAKIEAGESRAHYYDDKEPSFGLRVEPNGRKSFFWYRKINDIPPGRWTPEKIKEILKERGVAADGILVYANTAEEDAEMRALTDALSPGGKEQEVPPITTGMRIEGEMKAPISENTFARSPRSGSTIS